MYLWRAVDDEGEVLDMHTRDIIAFLESLTGELPANFATAPVLPSGAVRRPNSGCPGAQIGTA